MSMAPGAYVTVTTAPPSPNGNAPTGTWFVAGQTAQGPTGVAVPITSMADYANFLGGRVSYGYLYDCLDEFFHDGGVLAYVSRVVGPGAAAAAYTAVDRAGSPLNTLKFTAAGAGIYGNSLSVVIANGSVSNSYTVQVLNGTTTLALSPNLFSPADAVTWFNAQPVWKTQVIVTNLGSATVAPNNNPVAGTFALTGGADDTSNVADAQYTAALTAFTATYGPGQVSSPGRTTTTTYLALTAHAQAYGRVALLDVADSATAATLTAQAAAVQSGASDPSYAALFAPWTTIPGINSVNPGSTSPVPNRIIPPSALAAAKMAANDATNDANRAAAGPNGQSVYAIGVTQTYNATDLATLNNAGVNVTRQILGATTVYGFSSLALDPNWTQLNWVRMRMQMTNDFNLIADGFVFAEIDGKGQLFAQLNGALAGKCQQYWANNSLYGLTPASAFTVNTGPQVNTPATIAAGQLNAQVLVVLSPAAPVVLINVVKYLPSQSLPIAAH